MIIEEGSGRDFNPLFVEVFLQLKEQVIEVYHQID